MKERLADFLSKFGFVGALLKFLFGNAFCGRGGDSISANKLIALATFIYGLVQNDVGLIGIAAAHFGYKTTVDAIESQKRKEQRSGA